MSKALPCSTFHHSSIFFPHAEKENCVPLKTCAKGSKRVGCHCAGYAMFITNNRSRKYSNRRHNQNNVSRGIKRLFLISRKIVLENNGLRLLTRSRFAIKKMAISHFTGKKIKPFTNHRNAFLPSLFSLGFMIFSGFFQF